MDQPAGPSKFSNGTPLNLVGWSLDNRAGTIIEAVVDGAKVTSTTVDRERADVCAVYPGYVGCPKVGFEFSLGTDAWSAPGHLVQIIARDSDGNQQILAERLSIALIPAWR